MCRSLPTSKNISEYQVKIHSCQYILCCAVLPASKGSLHPGWYPSYYMSPINNSYAVLYEQKISSSVQFGLRDVSSNDGLYKIV